RRVPAGEAVPEGEADVGAGVVLALAELLPPAAPAAAARRGAAPATAGGQQHARGRTGPQAEEVPPAQRPLVDAVLAHVPTFLAPGSAGAAVPMVGRCGSSRTRRRPRRRRGRSARCAGWCRPAGAGPRPRSRGGRRG